jgi:hypothetical protein
LREHGALSGNLQFALSSALAGAEALDVRRLPAWLAHARAALEGQALTPMTVDGAPLGVAGAQESVHLRFLVGSALCAPGADPLRDAHVGAWGAPLARALSRQLARPGATLLALPRAPERLVTALPSGRTAQREIALQLFVGNALRRLRGRVGEPAAVLSAHRAADAAGAASCACRCRPCSIRATPRGFVTRCSRTSACPMRSRRIAELLADCRVADVRALPGIQGDRDPATGLLRFFRADSDLGGAPAALGVAVASLAAATMRAPGSRTASASRWRTLPTPLMLFFTCGLP